MNRSLLDSFIARALEEDIGEGDHSTCSCIPEKATGQARLLVKQEGILAGVDIAREVFRQYDPTLDMSVHLTDGATIRPGDVAFTLKGYVSTILSCERLVLNIMQRMSGIATHTHQYVREVEGLPVRILDTRKTTPGMRMLEKMAVRIGGGYNHRMGLYDMILLKDNHIDYAGGIRQAIERARSYLEKNRKKLRIEIEARSLEDVTEILCVGGVDIVMLDNFSIDDTRQAVKMIGHRYETESSGRIQLDTIRAYAECGVDYISVGALTHQISSLDMSLKASL